MEQLEGKILSVIFRNDENGYTVLNIDTEDGETVCVGSCFPVRPGESVKLSGGYVTHSKHGRQFEFKALETGSPVGDSGIESFLSSGVIKGIGPVLAKRIVDTFHGDTLDVIENNPEELAKVKGVSKKLAESASQQYRETSDVRFAVFQLQELGLSLRQAMACFKAYGNRAREVAMRNPYQLSDDIRGISFEMSDAIAERLGSGKYTNYRISSGIKYILNQACERQGSTCLPLDGLVEDAMRMLNESEETVRAEIAEQEIFGRVAIREYNGVEAIGLGYVHRAERYCAEKLMALSRCKPKISVQIKKQDENGVKLTPEQEQAVYMAMEQTVCVITGGPGTGKTTILNHIISMLERNGIGVSLAAPTGRAAKRMEKTTSRPAQTIHRLLQYEGGGDDDAMSFAYNEERKLSAEAVIIDETSMIDVFLMSALLSAIEPGTRVILTGDADQLPSIGPGNVLKDIIASEEICVARLTHVFRQHGDIAYNARRINQGEPMEFTGDGTFSFIPAYNHSDTMARTEEIFDRCAEETSLDELQIICPVKRGLIGTKEINNRIRAAINPPAPYKPEVTYGERTFRVGDKVMQTVNDYSMEWRADTNTGTVKGTGVYNGDMGVISDIDMSEKTVQILFDGEKKADYNAEAMQHIEHAYAITIHKSQGSEFGTVIMPLCYPSSNFLTRNLLYTAVTRAKKKLIIIGRESTIESMVLNTKISRRLTGMKYELRDCAKGNPDVQVYEERQSELEKERPPEEPEPSFDDLLKMLENEK